MSSNGDTVPFSHGSKRQRRVRTVVSTSTLNAQRVGVKVDGGTTIHRRRHILGVVEGLLPLDRGHICGRTAALGRLATQRRSIKVYCIHCEYKAMGVLSCISLAHLPSYPSSLKFRATFLHRVYVLEPGFGRCDPE